MHPLLIFDLEALRRKWENPGPSLAPLLDKFRKRLSTDSAFRQSNLYLPALLGDTAALREAREHIQTHSKYLGTLEPEDPKVELRAIYCWGPGALRMAVYFQWLSLHKIWTPEETLTIGRYLLTFCQEQMVSTLRSRTPTADNQSFSMSLTSAIVGHVFKNVPPLEAEASSLCEFGTNKVKTVLGYIPRDGYTGEGATYQSDVVSPLTMFATAFLGDSQNLDFLKKTYSPQGGNLLNFLRMESLLGSPGLLLLPWDHYGWQPQVNLAPIALHARLTGDTRSLAMAEKIWDRPDMCAWTADDRMWTVIFWPDTDIPGPATSGLGGWTLPHTGTTIDNYENTSRLILAWDKCSESLQGYTRYQTDPNNLGWEIKGVPLLGDGVPHDFETRYLEFSQESANRMLSEVQKSLIIRSGRSLETWFTHQQAGLIGSANTVIIDHESGYAPFQPRHGQLVFESRTAECHIVTAESLDYYAPGYDLVRARRTIASTTQGVFWVVDDYEALTDHTFTWQAYLRKSAQLRNSFVLIETPEGPTATILFSSSLTSSLDEIEAFPKKAMAWPDEGSRRLRLSSKGKSFLTAVCLIIGKTDNAVLTQTGPLSWKLVRDGKETTFSLPLESRGPCPKSSELPTTHCDLDESAMHLSPEPNEILLVYLRDAKLPDWRRTTQAMQTLTERQVSKAGPLIHQLLMDLNQTYHVPSVAAWCLGRLKYRPAIDDLKTMCSASEPNLALRAQWAVERMSL